MPLIAEQDIQYFSAALNKVPMKFLTREEPASGELMPAFVPRLLIRTKALKTTGPKWSGTPTTILENPASPPSV